MLKSLKAVSDELGVTDKVVVLCGDVQTRPIGSANLFDCNWFFHKLKFV